MPFFEEMKLQKSQERVKHSKRRSEIQIDVHLLAKISGFLNHNTQCARDRRHERSAIEWVKPIIIKKSVPEVAPLHHQIKTLSLQ